MGMSMTSVGEAMTSVGEAMASVGVAMASVGAVGVTMTPMRVCMTEGNDAHQVHQKTCHRHSLQDRHHFKDSLHSDSYRTYHAK